MSATRVKNSLKRTLLTLDQKLELVDVFESRTLTIKEIKKKFNCGKTQIYDIIKNKSKLIELRTYSDGSVRRMSLTCANEKINNMVFGWYMEARAQNLTINGPILQAQAKGIAEKLGNFEFKASNGWLNRFRRRYKIEFVRGYFNAKDSSGMELVKYIPNSSSESEHAASFSGRQGEDFVAGFHEEYSTKQTTNETVNQQQFTYSPDPSIFLDNNSDFDKGDEDKYESDENILQQLPELGIVKTEPIDPDDAVACASSIAPTIPETLVSYEVPLSPSSILPDLPTRKCSSPTVLPSSSRNSDTEPSPNANFAKTAAKRRRSGDGDEPQRNCGNRNCLGVRDEFTVFGEFVATKLRNLTGRHNQLLAQNAITKILIETEMKDIGRDSPSLTESIA